MDFLELKTGQDDVSRRLDKVIRIYLPDLSLSEIYKYLRKGLIKINGKKVKSDYKIAENDVINLASFIKDNQNQKQSENRDSEKSSAANPSAHNKTLPALPEIVFKNEHLLILDKPYDMLVHGSENSLDKIVEDYYNKNFQKDSLSFKPGPLHRIDRKTTGLIAFSLSLKGAQWFTENIKNHSIDKRYLGLIQGNLRDTQHWNDYISKDTDDRKSGSQNKTRDNGFHTVKASSSENENNPDEKQAITTVTPISHGKYKDTEVTFVEFHIKTGRTHQIRAQCALHNHPLLGDTAYGGKKYKEVPQEFYLQAYKLNFPENDLDLPEFIQIEPSQAFNKILKSCEIKK